MRLQHFDKPWKPHSGAQVLLGLGDTLVAFVHELDHLIPPCSENYDSWTSDCQPSYYSQICENGAFSCAVKYPLAMAFFKSDSSVSEWVSSSSYCQVTASATDDLTIAMISFSNYHSLS